MSERHPVMLVTSSLCDFFTPKEEFQSSYYENFIAQYSEIAVSAIVSQGNLDERIFKEPPEFLDNHIDEFIDDITENAMKLRKIFPSASLFLGCDHGELIQKNEERTFATEHFVQKSNKLKIRNRVHVLRTLNANAFFSYFSLFESTIEDIYSEIFPNSKSKVTGGILIEHCLKKILKSKGIGISFSKDIFQRSKLFLNMDILKSSWAFLNFIRNRQAHDNNKYDENSKIELDKLYKKISQDILKIEDTEDLNEIFKMNFGHIIAQVKDDGFLVFNNTLENFVRNTTLFIMESLYICELEKSNLMRDNHGEQ
ncbi:hypothetical protein [Pectobacterium versatile]|uniref:hypothetical protein n=1 Tax=Pectobacterium versatile TaxID=2488639 RepID=UPI002B24DF59|nr:hypothetical protein [Pectobacterium versatile]